LEKNWTYMCASDAIYVVYIYYCIVYTDSSAYTALTIVYWRVLGPHSVAVASATGPTLG